MGIVSFFSELKKRKVYRTAAAYAVVAFVIMQIIEIVFPMFGIPDWAGRMIIILLFLGFPITIVFSWMYDVGEKSMVRAQPMMVGGEADNRSIMARKRSWFIGAVTVVAIMLGYQSSGTIFGYEIGGTGGEDKSIAVLPFDNFSKDKDDEYLSDGITEDITMNLAKIKELAVISRTSVMGYKHSNKKIKEIAKELGVKYILEGSVRKIGQRVRIVSQLIDAPNDKHIWSDSYDREMEDLFDIQADVSKEIANAMEAELTDKTVDMIDMAPTDNMDAYILFQRARSYYGMYTEDGTETAIKLFKNVLDMDPNYAEAYAGLSDCYAQRFIRFNYGLEWIDSSLVAADRAIKINPKLPDGYKAKGLAYLAIGHMKDAGDYNYKALELNPGYHMAIANYGIYLLNNGQLFDSYIYFNKSKKMNPTSTSTEDTWLGGLYSSLGEIAIADKHLSDAHKLSPGIKMGYRSDILHRLQTNNYKEAEKVLSSYEANIGMDSFWKVSKGIYFYFVGDFDKAQQLLSKNINEKTMWKTFSFNISPEMYLTDALYQLNKPHLKLLNGGIKSHEKKIKNGSDNNDWIAELSALYSIKGEAKPSMDWLEKAIKAGFRDRKSLELGMFDNVRNQDRFRLAEREIDIYIQEERLKFVRAGLLD